MIVNDDVLNKWVVYSAFDFMERFEVKDELGNYSSDDDLIRHHLEKDERSFKVRFGWSHQHHDDCWFICEVKDDVA